MPYREYDQHTGLLACMVHNIKKINSWLVEEGEELGGGEIKMIKVEDIELKNEKEEVVENVYSTKK